MGKKKILLVEDEDDLRMLMAENLESYGYEVYQAEDGEEGLKQLLTLRPDLIISDVLMPRMNGNQFLKEVRELEVGKEIPFIVLTIRKLMKDYFESIDIEEFISKPFDIKELVVKIEQVFKRQEDREWARIKSGESPQKKPQQSAGDQKRYCNVCNKHVPSIMTQCQHCGGTNFRISYED